MADISKKFDMGNIVGTIKSLLNPEGQTPDLNPDDAIGLKIAEISLTAQELSKAHAEQAAQFSKLNHLLNELYKDIEALRQGRAQPVSAAVVETEVTATVKPKKETKKATTAEDPGTFETDVSPEKKEDKTE